MSSRRLLKVVPNHNVGPQSMIKRSMGRVNQWGTAGYSNFGHDQPERYPLISKVFHSVVVLGLVLPMLDWKRFGPPIEEKFKKFRKFLGYNVDGKIENNAADEMRARNLR